MTEATVITLVVALLAAIPPTLMAYASLRASMRNSEKADVLKSKVDEVHVLANSSLSKVQSSLETANEKIAGLERLVASLARPKESP